MKCDMICTFIDVDKFQELKVHEEAKSKRNARIFGILLAICCVSVVIVIALALNKVIPGQALFWTFIILIICGVIFAVILTDSGEDDSGQKLEIVQMMQRIYAEFDIAEINIYADRKFVQIKYFDENGILQKYEFTLDNVFTYNKSTALLKGHCVNDDYLIDLYIPYKKEEAV